MHPNMKPRHPVPQQSTDGEFPMEGENLIGRVRKTSQYSIGQGGFTDVYQGELRAMPRPVVVAIKIFRGVHINEKTRKDVTRRILRESRVWSRLNHPYVQPYYGYCRIDEVSPSLGLVSPFCGNGTIINYLQRWPDLNRLHLLRQVASGLKYLHDNTIVHADLSGNNILIDDAGNARVTDFGRARILGAKEFITSLFAGSLPFIAPEIHRNESDFSMSSDVYAFAMVAFQVFTGQTPMITVGPHPGAIIFYGCDGGRPFRNIDTARRISDPLWNLMGNWWSQDRSRRGTAANVLNALVALG